jgi:hypothetical protein
MSWDAGYQKIFLEENGDGPWPCHFCGEDVFPAINRERRLTGCIHHLDEDRTNHAPENLVPVHLGCHSSHHKSLHKWQEEAPPEQILERNQRIAEALRSREEWPKTSAAIQRRWAGMTEEERRASPQAIGIKRWWASLTPEEKAEQQRKRWGTRRRK